MFIECVYRVTNETLELPKGVLRETIPAMGWCTVDDSGKPVECSCYNDECERRFNNDFCKIKGKIVAPPGFFERNPNYKKYLGKNRLE